MPRILLLCLALFCVLALPGCARDKPKKSSARMYSGDAPTIKFGDQQETPGGYIHTY